MAMKNLEEFFSGKSSKQIGAWLDENKLGKLKAVFEGMDLFVFLKIFKFLLLIYCFLLFFHLTIKSLSLRRLL